MKDSFYAIVLAVAIDVVLFALLVLVTLIMKGVLL